MRHCETCLCDYKSSVTLETLRTLIGEEMVPDTPCVWPYLLADAPNVAGEPEITYPDPVTGEKRNPDS